MSKKYVKLRWRTHEKLKIVAESWHLKDEALGRFLRQKGLHTHDIKTWKEQMTMGIDGDKPVYLEERRWYKTKIEKLEKERKGVQKERKEAQKELKGVQKELKEAQIIIELQKKVKKLGLEAEVRKQRSKPGKK